MHGTSHYIGLDTHDVGSWVEPIKENMVFTVEPGIYIPEENLGIRLEDDIVIKNGTNFNLMQNIPIIADEIARVKVQGLNLHVSTVTCPVCNQGHLKLRQNQQKVPFWGCSRYPTCKATFSDVKGKPLLEEPKAVVSPEHHCPNCDAGLIRRPAKKEGVFWGGCSQYPTCDYRAFDRDGSPEAAVKPLNN